jgi:hypothetical protein
MTALAEDAVADVAEEPVPETGTDPGMMTIVYKIGILSELPPLMREEIFRAHLLRNKLVELELAHQANIAAIWATHPEVAEAQENKEKAEAAAEDLAAIISAKRQKARSAKTDPADMRELKKLREALKAARQDLRDKKSRAYALLKDEMEEEGRRLQAEVKAMYPEYIDKGLYWAVWNDVVAHHRTSVQMIKKKRREGQPADVQFHRFDGTGTIAVQLQRGAGDPPRLPGVLASGTGKWANVFQLAPWIPPEEFNQLTHAEQRAAGRGYARIRVGSGEQKALLQIPVRIHRMMPEGADIVMARITRFRIGRRYRSTLSVTARVPAPPMRVQGPLAAIHLGWRVLEDGAIRTAVIKGTTTLPGAWLMNPDKYSGPVVRGHGTWSEIVIPPSWREVYKRPGEVRGQRDRNLDSLRAWLREHIEQHPGLEELLCAPAEVGRHRSPQFYGNLASVLQAAGDAGELDPAAREAHEYLMAWRKQDWHLWDWEANERDQIIRRRDYAWQQVAAWICAEAALVVVDEWAVASLARAPRMGEEEDGAVQAARANRVLAAPGRLREYVVNAAGMRGVRIASPSVPVSKAHFDCGMKFPGGNDGGIMRYCAGCEKMVDQDYNSLENMLRWARTGDAR